MPNSRDTMQGNFSTDFLLRAFVASHTGDMKPVYRGQNEGGYLVHFDDVSTQGLWEEWQMCSASMFIVIDKLIDEYVAS